MDVWLCIALFHPFFCCQLIKMWSVPSLSCLYSLCWALSLLPFLSLPAKKRRVPQLVPHPALPSKPFSCCVSHCILGQPSAVNLTHLPVAGVAFPPSSLHSSQAVLVPPSFIFFSSATALPFAPTLSLIFFNGILGSRTVPQECPGSVLLCFCFVFFFVTTSAQLSQFNPAQLDFTTNQFVFSSFYSPCINKPTKLSGFIYSE